MDRYLLATHIALKQGDKYLLIQRADDGHAPLQWEFPGGKVVDGNGVGVHIREIKQAVLREAMEEINYVPEGSINYWGVIEEDADLPCDRGWQVVNNIFEAFISEGVTFTKDDLSEEHVDIGLFTREQALRLELTVATRKYLE
ncbi:MAG: NUDIX hydrolase [Candidatus Komeilibacteria bacterium]